MQDSVKNSNEAGSKEQVLTHFSTAYDCKSGRAGGKSDRAGDTSGRGERYVRKGREIRSEGPRDTFGRGERYVRKAREIRSEGPRDTFGRGERYVLKKPGRNHSRLSLAFSSFFRNFAPAMFNWMAVFLYSYLCSWNEESCDILACYVAGIAGDGTAAFPAGDTCREL